jgi:hypothetical protein
MNPIPTPSDKATIPAWEIPSFRVFHALQRGTDKRWLFKLPGGLGDVVCAEPVIAFAIQNFLSVSISIQTDMPELFSHLPCRAYRPGEVDENDFYVLDTIRPVRSLNWEFYTHPLLHCVDYISVSTLRCQLPNSAKQVRLPEFDLDASSPIHHVLRHKQNLVVVHAGRHWQSKTFPVEWWNSVIDSLHFYGFDVCLIGKNVDETLGYVPIVRDDVIDLRDQLSVSELVALLKGCKFVVTNDSSPIHIAAAGEAFIAFVASCKHPDFLYHWRKGQFGWRMKDFGHDGLYNYMSWSPVQKDEVSIEFCTPEMMQRILPSPEEIPFFLSQLRSQI